MKKLVDKIFRRYGVPILLQTTEGTETLYGFVQHTATSARKHLLPEYTPLGELPQGHYLILLPLYSAKVGQLLMHDGRWHIVRRIERIYVGSKAIYDWCLCEKRGEADTWGK